MSRLIALYPAAWRARYEAELVDLLEERPLSFRDAVDLIRGAVDARLHPQLVDGGGADMEMAPEGRVSGVAAISGGLVWLVLSVVVGLMAMGRSETDVTGLFLIAVVFMMIGLIGPLPAARRRQVRRGLAAAGILLGLGLLLPWELKGPPAVSLVALSAAGLLTLATLRAGVPAGVRWVVLGLAFVIPFAIMFMGAMGLFDPGPVNQWIQGVVLAPYGIAWLLLGILMVRRGAASNPTSSSTAEPTEALAA